MNPNNLEKHAIKIAKLEERVLALAKAAKQQYKLHNGTHPREARSWKMEQTKATIDVLGVAAVAGTIMDLLPTATAFLTLIWFAIRIWETKTVRKLFKRDIWNFPSGLHHYF